MTGEIFYGANEGNRTPDLFITSESLYQLSYVGIKAIKAPRLILTHLQSNPQKKKRKNQTDRSSALPGTAF